MGRNEAGEIAGEFEDVSDRMGEYQNDNTN
jgi:hypothetical protein